MPRHAPRQQEGRGTMYMLAVPMNCDRLSCTRITAPRRQALENPFAPHRME